MGYKLVVFSGVVVDSFRFGNEVFSYPESCILIIIVEECCNY